MKKHRFLIAAAALSILLHILMFIFAPELKSEINSDSYLKKITKISIFQETPVQKAPKVEESAGKHLDKVQKKVEKKKIEEKKVEKTGLPEAQEVQKVENAIIEEKNMPENTEISDMKQINENEKTTGNSENGVENGSKSGKPTVSGNGSGEGKNSGRANNQPYTSGELAIIPKAMNPKTPPYPESLEDEGVEGSVTLELLISKEGKVLKAKVIKSDHELFSESALHTVKNYKFSPGKLKDGSAVDSLIEFVIKFEIPL
ncbi:TonB family protein [bacterium]|nr:TonB family protein [bacterium]